MEELDGVFFRIETFLDLRSRLLTTRRFGSWGISPVDAEGSSMARALSNLLQKTQQTGLDHVHHGDRRSRFDQLLPSSR